MRSSYNKTTTASPFTELNTRPPGYKALEERVEALEKLVVQQDDRFNELSSKVNAMFHTRDIQE